MLPQNRTRPTVGPRIKAHTLRFLRMIATWMLIFVAFVCHPEWMRDSRRFLIHSIETKADQVPEPWGARLEIIERIWRGDLDSDRLHDSLAAVATVVFGIALLIGAVVMFVVYLV